MLKPSLRNGATAQARSPFVCVRCRFHQALFAASQRRLHCHRSAENTATSLQESPLKLHQRTATQRRRQIENQESFYIEGRAKLRESANGALPRSLPPLSARARQLARTNPLSEPPPASCRFGGRNLWPQQGARNQSSIRNIWTATIKPRRSFPRAPPQWPGRQISILSAHAPPKDTKKRHKRKKRVVRPVLTTVPTRRVVAKTTKGEPVRDDTKELEQERSHLPIRKVDGKRHRLEKASKARKTPSFWRLRHVWMKAARKEADDTVKAEAQAEENVAQNQKKPGSIGARQAFSEPLSVAALTLETPQAKPKSKSKAKAKAQIQAQAQTKLQNQAQEQSQAIEADGEALAQAEEHATTEETALERVAAVEHILQPNEMGFTALEVETGPVPKLAYGLDRVLFTPGVVPLRDLHSRVYNFDPSLEMLLPVDEFEFDTVNAFISASQDRRLSDLAAESGKKYVGSTSSMTGVLKHFHYLLSAWRKLNTDFFTKTFPATSQKFSAIQRAPDAMFLRWKKGVYAVDADKEYDSPNVLALMGKFMEKLLTVDKETFKRHQVGSTNQISPEEQTAAESHHYSSYGDFIIRSQLDAHDSRLPGTGIFDLKTRAVIPIRMDNENFVSGMDYEIRSLYGDFESYEREYYDMMRSTMLKYSLQARMGRMDGILVAYHNIKRMFGFQYISIPEMDRLLHGQQDRTLGDQEFLASLELLNRVFGKVTERFPEQTVRLHFETREGVEPFMYIFAEPVSDARADEIQATTNEERQRYEDTILGNYDTAVDETIGETNPADRFAERIRRFKDHMQKSQEVDPAKPNARKPVALPNVEQDVTSELLVDRDDQTLGDSSETNYSDVAAASQSLPGTEAPAEQPSGGEPILAETPIVAENSAGEGSEGDGQPAPVSTERQIWSLESAGTNRESIPTASVPNQMGTTLGVSIDDYAKSLWEAMATARDDSMSRSTPAADVEATPKPEAEESLGPLLGMILTTKSSVDGWVVERPEQLSAQNRWTIAWSLTEFKSQASAWKRYREVQRRRRNAFAGGDDGNPGYYTRMLKGKIESGRVWRAEQDARDAGVQVRTSMESAGPPQDR